MTTWTYEKDGERKRGWWPAEHAGHYPEPNPPVTARDRSSALHLLGTSVVMRPHPYERDPASGAGNCWCGDHQSSRIHAVVLT